MNFKDFGRGGFSPRRSEIKVDVFDDCPVFKIRGLDGEEFYKVREAQSKRIDAHAIASALMSMDGQAIAEAISELYGAVPAEFARRVEILVSGCVDPKFDRPNAAKFLRVFPVQAHTVAEKILLLTGEGSAPGESKGSGETIESATT